MKRMTTSCAWVVIGFLLSATSARADLIPWMYNWSNSPHLVLADAPGTGYIALTDEPDRLAVGSSDIVATNLQTFSTASVANPDRFTNKPYSLGLMLYDLESGQNTVVTFTGVLNGKLTAESSLITNTFTGTTTYSVLLGNNRYTATITSYTPPGPPGASNPGSIGAMATVTVEVVIPEVPEPGTLTLLGLGIGGVVWYGWRRRGAGR